MRIAIVTEKPFMARTIARVARGAFPDAELTYPICWPMGLYAPPLPRGLGWRDYPYIAPFDEALFRPSSNTGATGYPAAQVGRDNGQGEIALTPGIDAFNLALQQADQIICLMDPGHRLYHFDVARRKALGSGVAEGEVRVLVALDGPSIQRALAGQQPGDADWAQKMIAYGRARRYFDHQFAINSLAILGRTAGKPGWISKYQLQALYLLKQQPRILVDEFFHAMARWPGTGKYAQDEAMATGLGSPMSRAAIIEQLREHGWLELEQPTGAKRTLVLTNEGRAMLGRLHPGCQDPDLPFRLHQWCAMGLSESQPMIDRYLRTFFGRQKRFLNTTAGKHA